jgi:hypothetical protein
MGLLRLNQAVKRGFQASEEPVGIGTPKIGSTMPIIPIPHRFAMILAMIP